MSAPSSTSDPGSAASPKTTDQEAEVVLRFSGVNKSFGDRSVLKDLDFVVRKGEHVAILGGSGIGKSVLLRLVVGLLSPDEGQVELWGQSTTGLSEEGWVPLRRRIGMVFQSGALFDSMTVFENVAFPLRERRQHSEAELRQIVAERLDWVGLPDVAEQYPDELSGGMKRRVALARTLAFSPEFVLYDEPTTGLDPRTSERISILMRELESKLNSTVILVTHDIACARVVASRWAYLAGGRVVADGPPAELLVSDNQELREFLNAGNSARDLRHITEENAPI